MGRILASLLVLSRLHEEAHGFRRRRRRGRVRGVRAGRRASSVPSRRVKPGRIRHCSAPVRVECVLRGSATPEGAAVGRAARVRQDVASAAAAPRAALRRRLGRVHQAHPRSLLLARSRVLARQVGMAVSGGLRDGADGARPLPRRRYGRRRINPHASVHAVPGWEPHRWRAGVGSRDKGRTDKGARLRQQRLRGKIIFFEVSNGWCERRLGGSEFARAVRSNRRKCPGSGPRRTCCVSMLPPSPYCPPACVAFGAAATSFNSAICGKKARGET